MTVKVTVLLSSPVRQKPSTTRPLAERVSISQNAINAILPQLNSQTSEFNGVLTYAIAARN